MPSEGAQALPLLFVCTGNDRSAFDGGLHQDAGFRMVEAGDDGGIDGAAPVAQIEFLPAEKTMGTDGMRQQPADRRAG